MLLLISSLTGFICLIILGIAVTHKSGQQYLYTTPWSKEMTWIMYAGLLINSFCNVWYCY